MKIKNDQRGIAHVAMVVLVVVVIGVVGLAGWKVWDNGQKKKDPKTATTKTSSTKKTDPKVVPVSKYLEIIEFGIKIELSDEIEDAYYKMENGYPYLSTHSLDKYAGCSQVAAVAKAKVGEDNFGLPYTKDELEKISKLKIRETYFWVEPSNGGSCSDPGGDNPDQMESTARREFTSANLFEL